MSSSCCYCFNLRTGCNIAIIFSMMYSMLQLLFISSSQNSMLSRSVIQPPSISDQHLDLYNNVVIVVYITVLLLAVPALFALKNTNILLLSPWFVANGVSVVMEFLSFLQLLSHSKTYFSPISAFTFSIAFIILMSQIYCLFKFYSFYQETRHISSNSSDNSKSSHKEDDRSNRRHYSQFSRAHNSQRSSINSGKRRFVTRNLSLSKISEENFDFCSKLDNRDVDSHQIRMYSSEPKLGQKDEFIVHSIKIKDVSGNQKIIDQSDNKSSMKIRGCKKTFLFKLLPLFKQQEKILYV